MPAKKKAAAAAEPTEKQDKALSADAALEGDSLDARREAIDRETAEAVAATNSEREAAAALLEADRSALINREKKAKADPEGDIDQRMAALLKDHQEMGARPK